jgi:hypothetical protein
MALVSLLARPELLLPEPVADFEIAGRVTPEPFEVIDVGEPTPTVGRVPTADAPLKALVNLDDGVAPARTVLPSGAAGGLDFERRLLRIAMAYPCPFPPAKSADRLVMSLSGESFETSTFCATGFFVGVSLLMSIFCAGAWLCIAAIWVADNFFGGALAATRVGC